MSLETRVIGLEDVQRTDDLCGRRGRRDPSREQRRERLTTEEPDGETIRLQDRARDPVDRTRLTPHAVVVGVIGT